jgi:PAS domain S-box-containing protein
MEDGKILIVEDEILVALSLKRDLEQMGYSVIAIYVSGEEAIQNIEALKPDLVLMDIKLRREVDGITTAELIKERHNIPFIYLTAHSEKSTIDRAKKTEPYGYLLKPVNSRELQTAIEITLYKHKVDSEKELLTKKLRQSLSEIEMINKQLEMVNNKLEVEIAEHRHTEEILRKSEAQSRMNRERAEQAISKFAAIVESSDDAILGLTLDGIITSWNFGAEKLYGYTREEAIGESISLLAPPDRSDEALGLIKQIMDGEGIERFETVRKKKNGDLINVSITISPVKDSTGKIIAVSVIDRDITDKKKAEEMLRSYRQRIV